MKKLLFFLGFLLVMAGCSRKTQQVDQQPAPPPVQLLAADESQSLYQLNDPFINQDGDTLYLKDFEGKPTVVSMIFTSCTGACPMLVSDIQKIEKALGKEKEDVQFLLVSFDTDYDSPEVLKAYAEKHHLGNEWTLLSASKSVVRTLSVLLDVSFAQTDERLFSHENKVSVLDQMGILRFQKDGLGNGPQAVTTALNQILNS